MEEKEMGYVGELIGRFEEFDFETYAECIRVKVGKATDNKDNCWLLTLKGGILFVYSVWTGNIRLRLCSSVFNIECRGSLS